jgi:hypothetical protein
MPAEILKPQDADLLGRCDKCGSVLVAGASVVVNLLTGTIHCSQACAEQDERQAA